MHTANLPRSPRLRILHRKNQAFLAKLNEQKLSNKHDLQSITKELVHNYRLKKGAAK